MVKYFTKFFLEKSLINQFLSTELAIVSPYTHDILKALERWIEFIKMELNTFDGSSIKTNLNINLSSTNTFQSMLNIENTPFM